MNQMIQTQEKTRCFSVRRLKPQDVKTLLPFEDFPQYELTEGGDAETLLQAGQGWCGLFADGTPGAAAILLPLRTRTPLAAAMRWVGCGKGGAGGVLLPVHLHPDYPDARRFLRLCLAELTALYHPGRTWAILPYTPAAQNLAELYLSEHLALCGLPSLQGVKTMLFQARSLPQTDDPVVRVPFEDERRLRFYFSAGAVADSFGWQQGRPHLCLRSGA